MQKNNKKNILTAVETESLELLQSSYWRDFQESFGRKTYFVNSGMFSASIIVHSLPVVGNYLYIPRGPIFSNLNGNEKIAKEELISIANLAKETGCGWIRFDPENKINLDFIKNSLFYRTEKAPHNMQPKEIFVIDISESEDVISSRMKQKTRYNTKIASKKGASVFSLTYEEDRIKGFKYFKEFMRLVKETAERDKVVFHPEEYYLKMFKILPSDAISLFVAEYEGEVLATNLVSFFGNIATYLHGASSNGNRNLMATYALQWEQILTAKRKGCTKYDFGGVKTSKEKGVLVPDKNSSWYGITRFKLGFSPKTDPIEFEGSYDIVINPPKYSLYRGLQRAKALMRRVGI